MSCFKVALTYCWPALLVGMCCFASHLTVAADPKSQTQLPDPARELVTRALIAEANGKIVERGKLLQEAIAQSPDSAQARWHLGQVKLGDSWKSPEEVAAEALNNPALTRYIEMRHFNSSHPQWIWKSVHDWAGETYLRKNFDLAAKPIRAELKIWMPAYLRHDAIPDIALFINGKKVAHGKHKNEPSVFHIEKELRAGANTVAIEVKSPSGPGMLVWLDGTHHDGSIFLVTSETSWRVSEVGEKGWYSVDFDDHKWKPVVTVPPDQPKNSGSVTRPYMPSTLSIPFEESWARWCSDQKLEPQMRFHWARVLQGDPNHASAMKALGLKRVGNELLTKQQVDDRKAAEAATRKAMVRWLPSLEKACTQLSSKSDKVAEAARKRIEETVEPEAIPVFRSLLTDEKRDFDDAVISSCIVALGRIDDASAIDTILDAVCYHPEPPVIAEAAKVLAGRELMTFVPALMARFEGATNFSSKTHTTWKTISRGKEKEEVKIPTYRVELEFSKPGPEGEVRDTKVEIFHEKKEVDAILFSTSAEIDKRNAAREHRNVALSTLLSSVTGKNLGEEPEPWWDWWKKHNELEYAGSPDVRWVSWWDQFRDSENLVQSSTRPRECFIQGTPVWTRRGMAPIETILAGDELLSQDPQTGALEYKIALNVAKRVPTSLVRISIGRDSIVCTPGHRFWICGKGWRMAKQVSEGDYLHTLAGPLPITSAAVSENQQTYSMVMEDFHTFFVGREKILVHDAGAPKVTDRVVPGLPRSTFGQ